MMTEKEAIKRKFEWKSYNPYFKRMDLVFSAFLICFLISTVAIGSLGGFYSLKFFFIINSGIALGLVIVCFINIMTAERIGVKKC